MMAAKKKVFWLGELVGKKRVGRIKVDGKHIRIGESFAADGLDKDRLSTLRKAGCIGDTTFAVDEPVGDDNAMLRGRIEELTSKLKTDGDTIAGLQLELEAVGDATELKKQIVELESEVDRLTGEAKDVAALESDNEEKAALIKDQKAEIKALMKDGKK